MYIEKNWRLLGQGLAVLTLTAALAACGGESQSASPAGTSSTSSTTGTNQSPRVTGTPPTTVAINSRYSFTPTVTNSSGTAMNFNIQNKPPWASFGVTTGELSGTPAGTDTGTYGNIVIGATSGSTSTSLPAFAIQVTATPASSSSSGGTSSSSSSSGSSGGTTAASSSSSSGGKVTASSSSGAAAAFGIAVAGNKFVSTLTGSVIQLLGVSVSGLEQGSSSFANGVENYGNAADAGFAAMASWNINVVRIPLNEDSWLGVNNCVSDGGTSATLQSNLKQAVANANAAGLYVILDLHWTAPNSFGCPQGQGGMADADNSVAFWTSIANTFKGNPAVMFELFNEPFGTNVYNNWVAGINSAAPAGQSASDLSILRNGGTYDNGYWYQCNNGCNLTGGTEYLAANTGPFQVAGMQAMVNAIRATGATNVILSNPIGWAGQIETWLSAMPTDPAGQLAAGWHEDGSDTSDAQAVLAAGFPIVITEAYSIGDATFTWAMANHVGFSYWAWVDWGSPNSVLMNAQTHAPGNQGTSLKSSYCTQPSVNSASQC
jgi:endoglucanase